MVTTACDANSPTTQELVGTVTISKAAGDNRITVDQASQYRLASAQSGSCVPVFEVHDTDTSPIAELIPMESCTLTVNGQEITVDYQSYRFQRVNLDGMKALDYSLEVELTGSSSRCQVSADGNLTK